jgi:cytochrome c556
MHKKLFLMAGFLLLVLAGCGEPPDTHPGQPVTQRRAAFNKILKAFEPMGGQLRKDAYNPQQFAVLAGQLSELKEGPWEYFGADTNYPPTKATAKVWSDPVQFAAKKKAFTEATEVLRLAAESRNEKQVRLAYEALHETCRACHKVFKE